MYAGRLWPRTNQITRPWAIGDSYIGQKKLTIEQSIVRVKSYHAGCGSVNETCFKVILLLQTLALHVMLLVHMIYDEVDQRGIFRYGAGRS